MDKNKISFRWIYYTSFSFIFSKNQHKLYVEFYKELPLTVVQKSQNFKLEAHL